MNADIEQ